MKKTVSILLSLVMLFGISAGINFSVYAETSGDYEYELLDDGTAEITDYTGSQSSLAIPTTLDNYTVSSIGNLAFFGSESLVSVTFPGTVKIIGQYAFAKCEKLQNINLQGVTDIGYTAFGSCTGLTSVTLPATVSGIGDYAFYDCAALASIYIENPECYITNTDSVFTETTVIYGYENSTAQAYAEKYGRSFAVIDNSGTSAPAKVTGLYTSARGGYGEQLKISWNTVSGADSYKVYRIVDGKYTAVAATADTSYVFTDLVPGWEYYFKVSAVKNGREGALSDELHTCAACPPMDLPSVVAMDSKTIQVDWNITNAHGYVVQWSTDPEFKTGLNSAYVVGHNSDSYTISVPGSSQNYYVRTRAWRYWENNSLVYGIWTDGIKYGENLEKVTGLYTSARGGYGEQLKISWNKQRDIDFYNVYRLVDGKYTVVATTTDTSYVFTDLVPGWEYYFKVSSVRDGVESVLSDELHTCAACPPMDVPVLTKVSTTGFAYDALQVNWEVVNSHGYVVQWSTDPSFRTDLHSVYVTGHNKCEYTINTIGIYDSYYVRVRAWRYWDTGLVYGAWSQAGKTILDSADVEWVQEQAHAYIESKGMTVDTTVRSYSGRTSSAPYTTKEALLESVKEAIDVQYQGCIDAGWNGVSMYIKIEVRENGTFFLYPMYG